MRSCGPWKSSGRPWLRTNLAWNLRHGIGILWRKRRRDTRRVRNSPSNGPLQNASCESALSERMQLDMPFATITSKGQTTIPKEVRAAANLKPGDRIHFTALEDGTIIVRVKNRSIKDIS